ncbi:hypothetical protein [Gloeomargarita sp.]
MQAKNLGFPHAMRGFRSYLLQNNLDVGQYLRWLRDDITLKKLFLEGWENPNRSELLRACNHVPFHRFTVEQQRILYCSVMFEKLVERRPLFEKYKPLRNTRKELLLMELARKCLGAHLPYQKIRNARRSQGKKATPPPKWESTPILWDLNAEPHLWSSRQERSTTLTQLEKLGLVQCLREGRKTVIVSLTFNAIELLDWLTWPAERDNETIVNFYYDISRKYET